MESQNLIEEFFDDILSVLNIVFPIRKVIEEYGDYEDDHNSYPYHCNMFNDYRDEYADYDDAYDLNDLE